MHIVATAGHVDHGKSTLVRAITGIDPDRLAEEKRRGMTIDLGFAWTVMPSGHPVAFVDVPGHARFVKHMLAGVGMIDSCLFVVAATEGWKPQSEEHLRILELVGAKRGVVALTKVGLVDDETCEIAHIDVTDHLRGTFLEQAPVVGVDAPAGVGVDALVDAIDDMLRDVPPSPVGARPRLWVDRSFVIRGAGTVVTGTLIGGPIEVGDQLHVLPRQLPVRVRGLQSLHRNRDRVAPGWRVAVNLTGASTDEITRGDAVVERSQWRPTKVFDAALRILGSIGHDVTQRGAYSVYIGSGEHRARLRLLGKNALMPGAHGLARVSVPTALPLIVGDRFVLREHGRDETVGGGEILDVAPVLPVSRARPSGDTDQIIAERGWVDADELEAMTGERRRPIIGRWVAAPAALDAEIERVRRVIAEAGSLGADVAIFDERQRAIVATLDGIVVEHGRARDRDAPDDLFADHPLVGILAQGGFSPPPPEGVDRAELRELVKRGHVFESDGLYFAASTIRAAVDSIAELLRHNPDGVTAAHVRDHLGVTRKFALPLLTALDSIGATRRRGDLRIAGPLVLERLSTG